MDGPNPTRNVQNAFAVPLPLGRLRPAFTRRVKYLRCGDLNPRYADRLRAVEELLKGNTFRTPEICFVIDTLSGSAEDEDRTLATLTAMALMPMAVHTAAQHVLHLFDNTLKGSTEAFYAAQRLLKLLMHCDVSDMKGLCLKLVTGAAVADIEELATFIGGPLAESFDPSSDAHTTSRQITSNLRILIKVVKT